MKKYIAILLSALVLTGCSARIGHSYGVISSRHIDFTRTNFIYGNQIVGKSSNYGYPEHQKQREAVDDALNQNSCAIAIAEPRFTEQDSRIIVTGTAVLDPNCKR